MASNNQELSQALTVLGFGVLLALAPFVETPHLVQKLILLKNGWLHNPEDWFDLVLHSAGLVVGSVLLLRYFLRHKDLG